MPDTADEVVQLRIDVPASYRAKFHVMLSLAGKTGREFMVDLLDELDRVRFGGRVTELLRTAGQIPAGDQPTITQFE